MTWTSPRRKPAGKRRCLVTGGAGFLGRHLVSQLLASGRWEVTVFDVRSLEGESDGKAGAKYIVGDLRDPQQVADAVQGADVTANARTAAVAGIKACACCGPGPRQGIALLYGPPVWTPALLSAGPAGASGHAAMLPTRFLSPCPVFATLSAPRPPPPPPPQAWTLCSMWPLPPLPRTTPTTRR
jgi:hypothetical protein